MTDLHDIRMKLDNLEKLITALANYLGAEVVHNIITENCTQYKVIKSDSKPSPT